MVAGLVLAAALLACVILAAGMFHVKHSEEAMTIGAAAAVLPDGASAAGSALGFPDGALAAGSALVLPDGSSPAGSASAPSTDAEAGALAGRVGELVITCALAAVVEEMLFRGLLLGWIARLGRRRGWRAPMLAAAALSSAAFALLHGLPAPGMPWPADGLAWASIALKVSQALLFAIAMAGLRLESGGLRAPIAVHGAFDLLYFGSGVLATGAFPLTYICASPAEWGALGASVVVLLCPAALAWRTMARGVLPYDDDQD